MPHKCTKCEKIFKDGAAIILNGCPDCGNNKFLYVKDNADLKDLKKDAEKIVSDVRIPAAEPPSDIKPADNKLAPQTQSDGAIDKIEYVNKIDENTKNADPQTTQKEEPRKEEHISKVESVRIYSPGSYEVNLESLLERNEIVMGIKENGTYIVHLPSMFPPEKKKKDKKKEGKKSHLR